MIEVRNDGHGNFTEVHAGTGIMQNDQSVKAQTPRVHQGGSFTTTIGGSNEGTIKHGVTEVTANNGKLVVIQGIEVPVEDAIKYGLINTADTPPAVQLLEKELYDELNSNDPECSESTLSAPIAQAMTKATNGLDMFSNVPDHNFGHALGHAMNIVLSEDGSKASGDLTSMMGFTDPDSATAAIREQAVQLEVAFVSSFAKQAGHQSAEVQAAMDWARANIPAPERGSMMNRALNGQAHAVGKELIGRYSRRRDR